MPGSSANRANMNPVELVLLVPKFRSESRIQSGLMTGELGCGHGVNLAQGTAHEAVRTPFTAEVLTTR